MKTKRSGGVSNLTLREQSASPPESSLSISPNPFHAHTRDRDRLAHTMGSEIVTNGIEGTNAMPRWRTLGVKRTVRIGSGAFVGSGVSLF
jgi:hypothetical protein